MASVEDTVSREDAACQFDQEDEDDFDGESSDDPKDSESTLQLGFVDRLREGCFRMFSDRDWSKWDGGRVGGHPFWLNPVDIPSPKALECEHCEEPMSFLIQIYCPLDDLPRAYHRMLYLFVCGKGQCANRGSVVALRCQIGRENPFYSIDPRKKNTVVDETHRSLPRLCAVCGMKGPLVCAACRTDSYCSKTHQKLAWRSGHKQRCKSNGLTHLKSDAGYSCVFPEFDVTVMDESELELEADEELAQKASSAVTSASPRSEEEQEELRNLKQKDLYRREGVDNTALQDPTTFRFFMKTAAANHQILRYDRWPLNGGPLWVKTDGSLPEGDCAEPDICICGAPRRFEFQVMPQLLHFLAQATPGAKPSNGSRNGAPGKASESSTGSKTSEDPTLHNSPSALLTPTPPVESSSASEALKHLSSNTLDWGVLAVFTCTESCDLPAPSPPGGGTPNTRVDGSYIREYVWRQPPL